MPADILRPEQDDPATRWVEFAERMFVCGRLLREELSRQAAGHQLSEAEFSMLWTCREVSRHGIAQHELAAELAVSPAQVSGLVERLRRKGLLEGHRPSSDRRRQLWQLTAPGRDTLQNVLAGLGDWAGQLDHTAQFETAKLEETRSETGDTHRLMRLLDRLRETFRSSNASPGKPGTSAARRGAA